jgi:hypothetical protein
MSRYGLPPQYPTPGAGYYPTSGPIAHDHPCRKCGYNLRGLSADGRCPECGTPVGYSLKGDLLRFCDPGWLDTLYRGARMFVYGIAAIVFGFIAAVVAAAQVESEAGALVGVATPFDRQ